MLNFFETLLNMSITGAVIIAFVMIVRLFLKKLPRKYSYILWIIPAIRLLIPFSVAAPVSVFNFIHIPEPHAVISDSGEVNEPPALTDDIFTEPITDAVIGEVTDDGYLDSVPDGWYTGESVPQITGPVFTYDVITNPPLATDPIAAPEVTDAPNTDMPAAPVVSEVNTALTLWRAACAVWATGVIAMLCYLAYSFAATKRAVEHSYKIGEGLYSNGYIDTPFVFGYIKPRIYVPLGLDDKEFAYVVAHEKTHIKRCDHIIKAAASLILCVHWFNPFAWLAFKLMTVDMELSCDERAINTYDLDVRKDYARALLNMSVVSKKVPFHGMLSFGESSIKSRIKGILRMKKPAAWACVLAVAVTITAAVCLLTNAEQTPPDKVGEDTTDSVDITEPADTDEPAVPDVPSPYMAEPNSVVYSFAVCADMYEYVVQTEYDGFGRPIKETYLPEFMQADLGYYAYEYDAEGRLVKWIIGGTLSGVDVSVSFQYAEDGFVNSEVTYPKLPVYDQNKPYAATVEYHDNGVIKLLRLGEIYRKYDEFGRRTEEAGDCPVPSDAYYLFDDSAGRALINNGVFTLEYHDGSMLPHLGYFVYDYGRDEASYEARALYCSAVFEGNYLKGVASSALGIVDPDNVSDTGYSYSADGKLLPQFVAVEYDEKGQLVSVTYESGTITVDGAELPAKAAYIKYTYDSEGKLVYESREMRELGSQGEIKYKKTNEYTYTDGLRAVTEKGYNYNAYITAKESGYEITREYHENGVVKKETELSFTVSSYRSESHTVSEYSDWGFIVNRTVEHRSYDKVMRYEYVYRYGASGMNVSDCVEKCYENEKLYYTRTTNYYTGGGVLKDEYQYYHDGETVGSHTYRIYDSQGRVLRERLYKGAQAYVNEYSYIYGETESALVHTLEQAIDNYLRLDSQLFPPSGKGGVNARQYSDLKYDTEHEFAGWIAWRYLQSPLAENYGLAELDGTYRVYDALIEWTVSQEDKLSSIVIVVQRGAESYDVIAEVKLDPKDISGTVSKAGELSADGKWQYYTLDSNGTKYRFYAPVDRGIKEGDKVTVTFNATPSQNTDVDNVTLKVITDGASDGKEYNASGQLVKETVTETVDGKVHKTVHFYNYYTSEKAEDHITYFYINEVLQYVSKRLYYTSPVEALYMESIQYYNSDGSEGEYTFKRYTQGGMLVKERYYESGKPIEREYVYKDGVRSLIYTLEDAVKYWLATDSFVASPAKGGRNENQYSNLVIEYDPEYADDIAAQFRQGDVAEQHGITKDCDVRVVNAKFSGGGLSDNSILVVVVKGADGIFRGVSEVRVVQQTKTGGVAMIGALNADGTLREYTLFDGRQSYTTYMLPSTLDVEIGDKVRVSYLKFGAMKAQLAVKVLSAECLEDKSSVVTMKEYTTKIAVKNSDDPKVPVNYSVPSNWQNYGTVFNRNNIAFFRLEDYIYSVDNGIDVEGLKNYGDGTLSEVNVIEEKPGTDNDPFAYYVYLSWPDAISRDGMTELHRYIVENNGYYVTVGFFGDAEIPAETVDAVLRSIKVGSPWDDSSVSIAPEGNIIYVRLSGGELFVNVDDFAFNDANYLKKFLEEYSYMPQSVITFPNKDVKFECSPATVSRKTEKFVLYNTCVNYTVVDGAIYTKDMETLVAFPPAVTGEYTLPESVKNIDDNALYGSKLSKLIVPFGTRTGKLYGAENVVVEEDSSTLKGTVSDVGELTADGTGRKCLLQLGMLYYSFTAPADMDIRVGDLVTVTFSGNASSGINANNVTLSVVSHESGDRSVTMVEHSFSERINAWQSITVEFVLPSDWSYNGDTNADRNGVKFFEIYGSRPVSEGPAPERYRSATEYQITVLDERAGTDDDSFEYYLYTSTPEKYSPDRTYDVHRYIVEDNGWYITLSFLGDADVPQETVDEIVRSVKIGR
ncbi:MAG: hypothetical protein IIX69_06260 [Clostridia bacterium]|nr:hypothetical protein [Clostridia bacterium]